MKKNLVFYLILVLVSSLLFCWPARTAGKEGGEFSNEMGNQRSPYAVVQLDGWGAGCAYLPIVDGARVAKVRFELAACVAPDAASLEKPVNA